MDSRTRRWGAAGLLVVVGYMLVWIDQPVPAGAGSNAVVEQVGLIVMFGGPAVAGTGAVLGSWRRPHAVLAWVAVLLSAGYLWLIGLAVGFWAGDLYCIGDECETTSGTRIISIAAVLALLTLARAIELAVAKWRGA